MSYTRIKVVDSGDSYSGEIKESKELLQYKIDVLKKDGFKNIFITAIICSFIAFFLGYILSYNSNCKMMNVAHKNTILKEKLEKSKKD